jgi:DNA-directed RNA polymerase specialized sigma24 family protein
MSVKPPPLLVPDPLGKSSEGFLRVSAHAKDTVRRVRAYLRGRRSVDLESLTAEGKALTPTQWSAALPQQRSNGKLVHCDRTSLEQVADARPDPFETAYGQELVALLEARLPPEQVPYLDAFLADDSPKDIAPRLGISSKAASARMRRFRAKLGVIYSGLTPRINASH